MAKELYLQDVWAYVLGTKKDERDLAIIRAWRRLTGEAKEVLQDVDLAKLGEGGIEKYKELINEAFPESALRQLPRLYKAFFKEVRFRGSMEMLIAEVLRNKAKLEKADVDTKVSDGIVGFVVLDRSGLDAEEQKHVLGLTSGSMKLSELRAHLT